MLVHDYELFQMKEGESIEEMFARFSKIISDLKAFGKPYLSGDQVRKILRSLPTTWQTKVVTLESQDLNKLSYDELRGELIAFKKTHLKKTKQEEKKKTAAFKATTERANNDINDDPEALQEEIIMGAGQMRTLHMTNAKMTMRIVSWREVKQARFQSAPKESHLTTVKRIIRYLTGTISHGLWYPRSNNFKLEGFSDADLAGDKEDEKSTSGTYQLLGKALISWNSKKQGSTALSTTEAEYIVIG
uniref:Uncharacterized protein n=1 Tax=Nicotiana tabacum TaxID=4097 RepID=A0A1S3ZRY4_TOBAC|nr:PREDICTED: uncharacterized protein LOC107789712 [Nicotiana tabacum]